MNLLKDKNELALEFPKLTVYRPKFYSLKYNDSVVYECGCKNSHRLNDELILVFSMARPGVNFHFFCAQKTITAWFQLKVFLRQKLILYGLVKKRFLLNIWIQ